MKASYCVIALFLAVTPAALPAQPAGDRRIEDAARDSYNFRAVLDNRVTATARDGQVTLTGTVADRDAQALAADTVANLPGVTGVTNDIVVKLHYTERSDAWIAFKIRSLLMVKAHVSAAATRVTVQDGVATLDGTATNPAQKELTGVYAAEIDGVKSVINRIIIRDEPAVSEQVDDASITTQVRFTLLHHKSTRALTTRVTTADGVVHVTGEAGSAAEKALVTKLAQDVRGTVAVTNDMVVKD